MLNLNKLRCVLKINGEGRVYTYGEVHNFWAQLVVGCCQQKGDDDGNQKAGNFFLFNGRSFFMVDIKFFTIVELSCRSADENQTKWEKIRSNHKNTKT